MKVNRQARWIDATIWSVAPALGMFVGRLVGLYVYTTGMERLACSRRGRRSISRGIGEKRRWLKLHSPITVRTRRFLPWADGLFAMAGMLVVDATCGVIFFDPNDGDPFGFSFELGFSNTGSFSYTRSFYRQF